ARRARAWPAARSRARRRRCRASRRRRRCRGRPSSFEPSIWRERLAALAPRVEAPDLVGGVGVRAPLGKTLADPPNDDRPALAAALVVRHLVPDAEDARAPLVRGPARRAPDAFQAAREPPEALRHLPAAALGLELRAHLLGLPQKVLALGPQRVLAGRAHDGLGHIEGAARTEA